MTDQPVLVQLVDLLCDVQQPDHVTAHDATASAEWVAGWQAAIQWTLEQIDRLTDGALSRQMSILEGA